jgi:5-methylcytosine-specific restriction protein B
MTGPISEHAGTTASVGAGEAPIEQDSGWAARSHLRLRAAMEALAERHGLMSVQDLRAAATDRVPLTHYDESKTSSGAERWQNNLFWYLLTGYVHSGWLHATKAGYRITAEGRQVLATTADPDELFDACNRGYDAWDSARKESLDEDSADPSSQIVHGGNAANHVFRACDALLRAWRDGSSAFRPEAAVWSPQVASSLLAYLRSASSAPTSELPGLKDDLARILAAEILALLFAPLSDTVSSTKRTRIRSPLLAADDDPPGLPIRLSADLDHGFVRGGKAFSSDPIAMLRSFVGLLDQWWTLPPASQAAAWGDPWLWRDALRGMTGVDERIVSSVSLLVHPDSFTTLLRSQDRAEVVRAFSDRLHGATGDVDRDLRSIVVDLQREHGGHGVDLAAPPLVSVWSGALETVGAWLLRGQVEQRDRVPEWVKQGNITLTVGRFRQLPDNSTQANLSGMVDDLYADVSVVKREAKKRDVLNFVLAMRAGDLLATDDAGKLRLGRVTEGDPVLDSIGGSTLLTRPVAWSADQGPTITELPPAVRGRLRFKGEDVVNLSEIVDELEQLEQGGIDAPATDASVGEAEDEAPTAPPRAVLTCDTEALALRLHHGDDSWLRELLASLNERRQVVLEGPPGTGKTYLVQKLLDACGLTPNQQALVQFHPTYSYEDFVEGFRPTATDSGGARLTVVPGPLKRIADEARDSPGKPHILVIDEITARTSRRCSASSTSCWSTATLRSNCFTATVSGSACPTTFSSSEP